MQLESLAPDVARLQDDLTALSGFTEPGHPGWTRRVFSDAYRASREWICERMRDAGLDTHRDAAGNIVGILRGTGNGPAIATGSHTDTVVGGGRFDGIVGVIGGIEVARRLRETGTRLRHDLRVVDFLGEEPNEFGVSCLGSRALSGQLSAEYLSLADRSGRTLGEAMRSYGVDPDAALRSAWPANDLAGFVELHIEQGPLLERRGTAVGVVTAIAGIERLLATFVGRADHAGTMPMADRRDALSAAAEAILTVERVACDAGAGHVATTGRIESGPGASNVVPDRARIWTEMRSVDQAWLTSTQRKLAAEIVDHARARGVDVEIDTLNDQSAVPAAHSTQDMIAAAADSLALSWTPVPSGAGHDAAHMAGLAPMGMVFVPSRGGRSHCPEEWTDVAHVAAGVHVLAAALVRLDRQDGRRSA